MNAVIRFGFALIFVFGAALGAGYDGETGQDNAKLGIVGSDGKTYHPLDDVGAKAVLLVFVTVDCPISNAYSPELSRIYKDYASRGVRVYFVHVDPDVEADDVIAHAKEYKLKGPVFLLDRDHRLVKRAGATITPEAAVFSNKGKLLYRGRIDDLYGGVGKKRRKAANRDLRRALTAVLAGKPVEKKFTQAFGCYVPNLKQ